MQGECNFRASERRAELVRAMPSAAENVKKSSLLELPSRSQSFIKQLFIIHVAYREIQRVAIGRAHAVLGVGHGEVAACSQRVGFGGEGG